METRSNNRTRLTVITGRPGSGKTTLAHSLAKAIRCPAFCRDEFKEGLVNAFPAGRALTDVMQRQANDAFFQCVELTLKHGVTLIAEAAFQHRLWAPRLNPLIAIGNVRIIVCSVDPRLARSRHIERGLADPQREQFHGDPPVQAAREGQHLPIDNYHPPDLQVPTLVVDTTDEYRPALERIIAFARGEETLSC